MTVGIVSNVAVTSATGFDAGELRGASIHVCTKPHVNDVFDEHFRDLTRHSLAVAPFRSVTRKQERFAFLLPDGTLPDRKDRGHFLYRSMLEQGVTDRQLLQTALVIDERVQEAVDAFGLIHSTCYGDNTVVAGIARFLHSGTCPDVLQQANRLKQARVPANPEASGTQ